MCPHEHTLSEGISSATSFSPAPRATLLLPLWTLQSLSKNFILRIGGRCLQQIFFCFVLCAAEREAHGWVLMQYFITCAVSTATPAQQLLILCPVGSFKALGCGGSFPTGTWGTVGLLSPFTSRSWHKTIHRGLPTITYWKECCYSNCRIYTLHNLAQKTFYCSSGALMAYHVKRTVEIVDEDADW